MSEQVKHTATPWKGDIIVDGALETAVIYGANPDDLDEVCRMASPELAIDKANRDFIVTACNAHDELVAVCERTLSWLTSYHGHGADKVYKQMRDALENAKVKP